MTRPAILLASMDGPCRRSAHVAARLVAALGILLALAACGDGQLRSDGPLGRARELERALREWREASERTSWAERAALVKTIEDQVLVRGLTREEVIQALGPPQSVRRQELLYNAGNQSGFGIDPVVLHVAFDGEGRLQYSYLLQH